VSEYEPLPLLGLQPTMLPEVPTTHAKGRIKAQAAAADVGRPRVCR
jgi:hypothetical protein